MAGSERLAVIGDPIDHTLSPAMQTAALHATGLEWSYEAHRVRDADLGKWTETVRSTPYRGFNITIPHKSAIFRYLDWADQDAVAVGAVNTVVNEAGFLRGYNTDLPGFLAMLHAAGMDPSNARVVLFGAGGAARAVVFALADRAQLITIVNRNLERAQKLAEAVAGTVPMSHHVARTSSRASMVDVARKASIISRVQARRHDAGARLPLFLPKVHCDAPRRRPEGTRMDRATDDADLHDVLAEADLVVNATSLGMGELAHLNPLPPGVRLSPGSLVIDLVYGRRTPFMAISEEEGCRVFDGLEMLIQQGAESFRLWTGESPDLNLMRAACTQEMERRAC